MPRARSRDEKSYVVEELHDGAILLDDREIFVHPYIPRDDDDAMDTDFRMAAMFLKNMRLLMTHDKNSINIPILVHFYNTGGEWAPGMQIYDSIQMCQTYITSLIHGDACSMGSIIPLAADRVVMMPNASILIHEGNTDIGPSMTRKQARSWAENEEKNDKKMYEIYTEAFAKGPYFKGKSSIQILNFIRKQLQIKEDWFMDAQQAVDFGFAHGILGDDNFLTIESIKVH